MDVTKKIQVGLVTFVVLVFGGTLVSTNQPTVSEMQAMDVEQQYIEFLKYEPNKIIQGLTEEQLIEKGYQVCTVLDENFTINQAVVYLATERKEKQKIVAHYAERVIVGAVAYFCNRHSGLLQ